MLLGEMPALMYANNSPWSVFMTVTELSPLLVT